MTARLLDIAHQRCLVIDDDGPIVRDAEGARELIEEAMAGWATVIVVPAGRLDAEFFQLRSGFAGELLQKAANYGFKFAVVGDVSRYVAASDAFRDFVIESNRGRSIFFSANLQAFAEHLAALDASPD
ncbi:MAG: DUF4180 domain-containing protein [Chloroflexi bacterium]|nr:DUF4180 domain-containing protein [Chloroflexota bacterium]